MTNQEKLKAALNNEDYMEAARLRDLIAVGEEDHEPTLDDFCAPETDRMTGRSTRLVDGYVQRLFAGGAVEVRDHVNKRQCHLRLTDRVVRRLAYEHPSVKLDVYGTTVRIKSQK